MCIERITLRFNQDRFFSFCTAIIRRSHMSPHFREAWLSGHIVTSYGNYDYYPTYDC